MTRRTDRHEAADPAGSRRGGGWRLGLVAGALAAALFLSGALASWERSFGDWLFVAREWVTAGSGAAGTREPVVVAAIDGDSLARLGRWPWPRAVLAGVVERIAEAGARVIGLDVLLTEPSPDPEDDARLAEAIARAGNVVLAAQVEFSARRQGIDFGGVSAADARLGAGVLVRGLHLPLKVFERGMAGVGHVNFLPGRDGIVRKLPLGSVPRFGVPGFDEEIARLWRGQPNQLGQPVKGRPAGSDASLGFLPIDFHLHREPGQVPSYARVVPLWRIFDDGPAGDEARESLRGKVVLVGMTAGGDNHYTPLRYLGAVPGVFLHAASVEMLLTKRPLRQFPSAPGVGGGLIIALLAVAGGAGAGEAVRLADGKRHVGGLLAALGLSAAIVAAALYLFAAADVQLAPAPAALAAVTLAYLSYLVAAIIAEEREKRFWAALLRRYVSDDVADELARHPEALGLGGRKAEVAVLFADLRGFTTFAEREAPERVVTTLNAYLGRMANEVLAAGGLLDKFTGDGLMAVFGAIDRTSGDTWHKSAAAALRSAEALVQAVSALNELRDSAGLPTLGVGVGLHVGVAVVGNVGSSRRSDFTVVGDVVNAAARLVEAAGPGEILLSEDALLLADARLVAATGAAAAAAVVPMEHGWRASCRGEAVIRGKSQPVRVWVLKCDPGYRIPVAAQAE